MQHLCCVAMHLSFLVLLLQQKLLYMLCRIISIRCLTYFMSGAVMQLPVQVGSYHKEYSQSMVTMGFAKPVENIYDALHVTLCGSFGTGGGVIS